VLCGVLVTFFVVYYCKFLAGFCDRLLVCIGVLLASQCSICEHENSAELEVYGRQATDGAISWREAARLGNLTHAQGLKNHMERHFVTETDKVHAHMDDVLGMELAKTEQELIEKMRLSPAEVKPLYATAIRNLRGLLETKPSQQHLIAALKGIHEITGMRMEQQMMLAFGAKMFGELEGPEKVAVEVVPRRELEAVYEVLEEVSE
jgi:hypothetical protein